MINKENKMGQKVKNERAKTRRTNENIEVSTNRIDMDRMRRRSSCRETCSHDDWADGKEEKIADKRNEERVW